MPGRKKLEWTVRFEALKAELPKDFNGKKFRGCRMDGKLSRECVGNVCKVLGYKDKADAVYAYLAHVGSKSPSMKKGKDKKVSMGDRGEINFLSKRTYKELSIPTIAKLIKMLGEIEEDRKQAEIDTLNEQRKRIDAKLQALNAK